MSCTRLKDSLPTQEQTKKNIVGPLPCLFVHNQNHSCTVVSHVVSSLSEASWYASLVVHTRFNKGFLVRFYVDLLWSIICKSLKVSYHSVLLECIKWPGSCLTPSQITYLCRPSMIRFFVVGIKGGAFQNMVF